MSPPRHQAENLHFFVPPTNAPKAASWAPKAMLFLCVGRTCSHPLTYGVGNPVLTNVVIQEHLREEKGAAGSHPGLPLGCLG